MEHDSLSGSVEGLNACISPFVVELPEEVSGVLDVLPEYA